MLENLKCKLFGYSRRKDMKRKVIATSLLIFSLVAIPSMVKISAYGPNQSESGDLAEARKLLKNLRDLGGYETEDGRKTFERAFLRSDLPCKPYILNVVKTRKEVSFKDWCKEAVGALKRYGVKTVIDLRHEKKIKFEIPKNADGDKIEYDCTSPFKDEKDIDYLNVQMIDPSLSPPKEQSKYINMTLPQQYIECLIENQKNEIKQVFDKISESKEGTVFINCVEGRDRTGIISMIILGLAGVKNDAIVQDYLITYVNREDNPYEVGSSKYKQMGDAFREVIDYVNSKYGSFQGYLESCGVSEESIKKVRERII